MAGICFDVVLARLWSHSELHSTASSPQTVSLVIRAQTESQSDQTTHPSHNWPHCPRPSNLTESPGYRNQSTALPNRLPQSSLAREPTDLQGSHREASNMYVVNQRNV